MNPLDVSRQLVKSIKSTKEFQQLKNAKMTLTRNAKLKKSVEDYQQKQIQIFQSKLSGREIQSRMTDLNRRYADLTKIPEVAQYLKAGEEFDKMMTKINQSIGEAIDRELDS